MLIHIFVVQSGNDRWQVVFSHESLAFCHQAVWYDTGQMAG